MSNFTEEQIKKGQAKYEADSLPNHIALIGFLVIALLITLADNLFN